MDTIKVPGPDHPITLAAVPGRMQAKYMGHVIADSADVLMLKEASYKAVAYFPRQDVAMAYMGKTKRTTHCPYKGEAVYFTLTMDGEITEDTVWSYEEPYPAMEAIRGRLAFYPNHVEVYEVAGAPATDATDQTVLHTDAGAGSPQREGWAPNVSQPDKP